MTYYAVTNDPNELAHFGIKGMKWGIRRTDAQLGHPRHTGSKRPRSAAYKKAQSKLGKMMKSGIKKAQANWRAYNSPEAKYERQTNKAIQLARKGKLKYGKLTDDQVRRVTERLNLERQARQLSSEEKTFGRRLRESVTSGVISGVGAGVGSIVSERIGRGAKLKTKRMELEQQSEFDKAKERRLTRNAEKAAKKKDRREIEQIKRKDALEFEKNRRTDEYAHERDRLYENERIRNIAEYGAAYDDKGNFDYSSPNINNYYNQRFIQGRTLSEQRERDRRSGTKAYKAERRRALKAQKDANKNSYRIQRESEKIAARENRFALDKAGEQLKQEQWLARQNAKYDRALERQARKDAKRTARLMSGSGSSRSEEERRRIDERNTSRRRKRRGR